MGGAQDQGEMGDAEEPVRLLRPIFRPRTRGKTFSGSKSSLDFRWLTGDGVRPLPERPGPQEVPESRPLRSPLPSTEKLKGKRVFACGQSHFPHGSCLKALRARVEKGSHFLCLSRCHWPTLSCHDGLRSQIFVSFNFLKRFSP